MRYFKIALLTAAMAASSLTSTFPAFAGEPVGADVTIVEAGTSNTSEGSVQNVQESRETSSSRESKGRGASIVGGGKYTSQEPGVRKGEKEEAPAPREASLGRFAITGYCDCEQCSGGHSLTYSGTVPTPNHIISADLNYFPLGTKLETDGTTYTVGDKGSSVNSNILDIYYDSHQEVLAKGTYTAEIFLIQD